MPVFVRGDTRILYVHVPKTGGTSIEMFFEKNGFEVFYSDPGGKSALFPALNCSPQHLHAEPLRSVFNMRRFKYRFMTVRHPFDRLVSEYRMRATEHRQRSGGGKAFEDFDTWVSDTFAAYADNPFILDNHIRPQVDFWLPGADASKNGCDVFRQESGFGDAWVQRMAQRLGFALAQPTVGSAMRADQERGPSASAACVARIVEFYRRDFAFFGYDVPAAT